MNTKRRLISILCSLLLLTGVLLLPTAAAPVAPGFSRDVTWGNVASQRSSTWHIETVDSVGDVGWGTSIAVDDSGSPHIAYYTFGVR